MRASVWCSAIALTLLVVASNAIRTVQGEGISRVSRRPSTLDRTINNINKTDDIQPTLRPRGARSRDETPEPSTSRSRSRSRIPDKEDVLMKVETQLQSGQHEQFESRRSNSRSRSRQVGNEATSEKSLSNDNVIRGRSRQSGRKYTPTHTDQPQNQPNRVLASKSSRAVNENKPDLTKLKLNESPLVVSTVETASVNQIRRRSSTVSSVEEIKSIRPRGRINVRTNPKALDLEVSGTTNTFTAADKEQIISRTNDLRNSRKLRYKTRTSEIDTNLTGEGITVSNEVVQSSPKSEAASQSEIKQINSTSLTTTERTLQQSTENISLSTSTLKSMKVVRRPITRSNGNSKSTEITNKSKVSDEINEDDNYPDSFKALIQAKNATQSNSAHSESLPVRASQIDSKTHTPTQSITTNSGIDKHFRLRKKLKNEESIRKEQLTTAPEIKSTTITESPKPRSIPYRPRGTFLSRSDKAITTSTTESTSHSTRPSTERQHKFSRKFKTVTEPSKTDIALKTKRVDNSFPRKQVIRSSLFSRKNDPVNNNKTILISDNHKHDRIQSASQFNARRTLPSTSYYSRLRNSSKTSTTETNNVPEITETVIAEKKHENTADFPLIFTYLSKPSKIAKTLNKNEKEIPITLDEKETQENSTENEILNNAEESENKITVNTEATTQKYHANYKEEPSFTLKENAVTSAISPIRNIQTRKYRQKPDKNKDQGSSTPVIFKAKERRVRKYGDTSSKTTEAPGNSIIQEPDKPKNKFSSKYRGSYLDKPFYKPTVPTVTPSTAWLKFFVTDEFSKSVEEPILFGDTFSNDTTGTMSRMNFTSPTYSHESSLELVEGEEIQLGPDMNAIAFTKTRRPLSSADLRLSESLVKPLQVLNVEASQHSPSVTVSIFDALAEILTSTPQPRISTTTEIFTNQNNEIDIMHTLDGVSSNVNVNSVTGFASQETVKSKDSNINTNAMFVQTTEQIKPIVFNSLPVGENVTPSLKAEDEKTPVTSPKTVPTPTPTTPISARKPFAFKVLYSDTESPKDRTTTAAENVLSTDKPTMVYNSISDLLLSNNGLVSSGLTSMLSDNIRSIIENMDEESKSRLSVGMTNLMKTLSPGALNNTTIDDDSSPSITTPYSLEDIKDTENIDVVIDESSNINNNILQNVEVEDIVNRTETLVNSKSELSTVANFPVNISQFSVNMESLVPESGSETSLNDNTVQQDLNIVTITTSREEESTTRLSDASSMIENNEIQTVDESSTNKFEPVPSFTNSPKDLIEDFVDTQLQPPTLSENLSLNESDKNNDLQDPTQVSQLELWILSKKARILKMIEDLILEHKNEIANPPFNNLVQRTNETNVPLSSRLAAIMNTVRFTTETPDSVTNRQMTPNSSENLLNSSTTLPIISTLFPEISNIEFTTTTQNTNDNSFMNSVTTDVSPSETASEIADAFTSTLDSILTTTVSDIQEETTESLREKIIEDFDIVPSSTIRSSETTTEPVQIETSSFLSSIATSNSEETTPSGIESTTATVMTNERKPNDFITNTNMLNVATRPTFPKKDFVIFGILPNNTVVRKDPNDNPLEALTEASPYIIYGVLPNNTIIRKFPNGTRVPRIMQKIDVLPISPWSLKNPYSPIHNIPAIVRPQSNPIRVSTNTVISIDTSNNEKENSLTIDTVNNLQIMIPSSALNINDSSSLGITTTSTQPPAEKSTASHVLSLRTSTMLPSVDEILLNSISLATKEEMVISSMTSSTPEPRILTLDIDPETKQIRTEKPSDGNGNTVFKFIPIEDVTVPSTHESNVLKIASPKIPKVTTVNYAQTTMMPSTTETITQTPQIQTNTESISETTTIQSSVGTSLELSPEKEADEPPTPILMNEPEPTTVSSKLNLAENTFITPIKLTATSSVETTTEIPTASTFTSTSDMQSNFVVSTPSVTEGVIDFITFPSTTNGMATLVPITSATNNIQTQTNSPLLESERNAKNLDGFNNAQILKNQQQENARLLQALLLATEQNKNIKSNSNSNLKMQATTTRSIEDDIRQFEEDTKLLKALLQATGRDPASLNIPSLGDIKTIITTTKSTIPSTTLQPTTSTQTSPPTTTQTSTVSSINDDINRIQEDTKLLQALLQATGNKNVGNMPIISGLTSNVRIASNPLTTSMEQNPTTSFNIRPVYTTTQAPTTTTAGPQIITVSTLQSTTDDVGISTTFRPVNVRIPNISTNRPTVTSERPSSSTYSDEEDLLFLQNLKSVLNTNNNNEDPETALANRVIALAVERSLNEIQVGKSVGTTKVMTTTAPITTTTERTTTTTRATTTLRQNIPSIEDDIKQFEQDTKLLQALLKATGQDPSKFNIPTLPTTSVSSQKLTYVNDDLKLLSNLLASPSPLNEPFDPLIQKSAEIQSTQRTPLVTTTNPYGIKIAVKDNLKNEQDDAKLLQTLIKLQDAQETTTMRSKLAITGHSPDEALQKLIQKTQPAGMMSEATKPSMALSTEYGNSNDALLAALLKEQGFGPTTASSLDEQIRLAALLNQVVVTPKARRTTTPPPPPAPRRPILDGLAWLWQQWRDTAPGSQAPSPSSRPAPTRNQPAQSASTATSSRVNWFGSGPFVGNADERPSANRIPLEPPSAVEQPPGRGQLVSAAINVTRAFSQFLGAAIQGAAQTVQNVFRAGQKAASDVYTNGSG